MGYKSNKSEEVIIEDAPDGLREFFIDGILDEIIYIDDDDRYASSGKPLGIKRLYKQLCFFLKIPKDVNYWDTAYCWDILMSLIRGVEWYNFYDIIELVGNELREENEEVFGSSKSKEYSFASYREAINELFEEANVGYRLDKKSELYREIPQALQKRMDMAQEQLTDRFAPARIHYKKARHYLDTRPSDPENSIKEMVSAVESVGRILYPNTQTLGDVVKVMRKANQIPPLLLTVVEKFYAYASAEPAIRHGGTVESTVLAQDAEFSLHMGTAIIRYFISRNESEVAEE